MITIIESYCIFVRTVSISGYLFTLLDNFETMVELKRMDGGGKQYMCNSSKDQSSFLAKIQRKREEMFILGEKYGLGADETITCSRELDQLLNDYYHIYQSTSSAKTTNQSRKQSFVLFSKPYPARHVQSS